MVGVVSVVVVGCGYSSEGVMKGNISHYIISDDIR